MILKVAPPVNYLQIEHETRQKNYFASLTRKPYRLFDWRGLGLGRAKVRVNMAF
jgi:hypothetical protein